MSTELIKQLRKETQISIAKCKEALEKTSNDIEKAKELLLNTNTQRNRDLSEGIIEQYIHSNNKIGVLVHLACETDFVARNREFKQLAKDLAIQIASSNPQYLSREDTPQELIVDNSEILLEQFFVKDTKVTVQDLLTKFSVKFGEQLVIQKFIRFEI